MLLKQRICAGRLMTVFRGALVFAWLWPQPCLYSAEPQREARLASLNEIATTLRTAMVKKDTRRIVGLCRGYDVDLGVDDFISCGEFAKIVSDHSGYLYCRYFDTSCYRERRARSADSRSLRDAARIALCIKDILTVPETGLTVKVAFARPRGAEELDQAVITFITQTSPETYGEVVYPYARFSFWKGRWVLSAFFPEI